MLGIRRVPAVLILIYCLQYCQAVNNKGIMGLLSYMQKYENGSFLLPPVLIFPTILLPFEKHDTISNNNDHTKLGSDINEVTVKINDDENDIKFRQSLNRGAVPKKRVTDAPDNVSMNNDTDNNETTTEEPMNGSTETDITETTELNTELTTESKGLYPDAKYNNTVNDILLTVKEPKDNLPPIDDDRWNNFVNSKVTTETSRSSKGPYSNAFYNNQLIDQLSITTNTYTNEQLSPPSPKDDRLRTFPTKKSPYSATGFKPLAGLYYDGFLHKPVLMVPGFIPRKYYNLY